MHGIGNFSDPRLNDPVKYPIAVENKLYDIRNPVDLITPKLSALEAYQFSLEAPKPPAGSYNEQLAARGKILFITKAKCASCHVPPKFTEPGNNLHSPADIGIDDFDAKRSPTGKYRTTPLGGLFTRMKGGFYHDGRFPNLSDVVNHYNNHLKLSLSASEKQELVEYLKSL
jgi:cytochrome c peroxidase